MNSSINVWKFIFSVLIVIFHINVVFGTEKLQGMYIFADWFFVFAGYTLARRVEKLDKDADTFIESCIIIKDRLKTILPYYFVSCTVALIVKLNLGVIKIEDAYYVHKIVYEYLLLSMTPIETVKLTDTSWFLSAMWMALILIVPLAVKFRRHFFRFSIIIYVLMYMYFYKNSIGIYGPGSWTDIGYKGFCRALADISIGTFGYELGHIIDFIYKKVKDKDLANNIFSITLSIIVTVSYIIIIRYVSIYDSGDIFYYFPFIFSIIIMLQMHIDNYIFIKDNIFTRFLGKISMILFMNHSYYMIIIEEIHKKYTFYQKTYYAILYTTITTLSIYLFFEIINVIKIKLFGRNEEDEEDVEQIIYLIEDKRRNNDVIIRDEKFINNFNGNLDDL